MSANFRQECSGSCLSNCTHICYTKEVFLNDLCNHFGPHSTHTPLLSMLELISQKSHLHSAIVLESCSGLAPCTSRAAWEPKGPNHPIDNSAKHACFDPWALWHPLSLSISLYLYISISLSLYISISLYVYIYLSLSLSLFLSLSLSLPSLQDPIGFWWPGKLHLHS